ncbi:MAG: MipA/OmpV family protein [Rhodospirillaceae bacterium]|jgi:MipA family protein|nr:MipA/OmpV family protein [Rhodospirillaceae bacterium]MBT5241212.1 MipA/OmpV family protein [Rhodospirillaceae bacterium]MBT5565153.1 MipA/OmpV family protein [Rhodospirillaceae bacterium]MBT6088175.1 MipA/OmpV family protein [Rhodospirillaceae bacterium]MBT6959572.1 MipA/OmpV family protein [Rhodospirillaceae bacterium]
MLVRQELNKLGFVCALLCLGLPQAQAQSIDGLLSNVSDTIGDLTDVVAPGVTNIRIGLGPVFTPAYEGSDDYEIKAAPLISFRYLDLVQVDNNQIRVNVFGSDSLFRSEHFKAGPILKLDFGRDETDSPDLLGLGDVGTSLELGVFASYTAGPARARIRAQQDVLSGHSGMRIVGDLGVAVYRSDRLAVTGNLSATWTDSSYMSAFFSVTAAQAVTSGLTAFTATSGLKDISLAFGANYKVTESWAVVANAGYSKLLGDAKNSPIVSVQGSSSQFVGGVFAVYSF